ncbi:MAG: thermonuclease family protein [Mariprofundaceae bacterium]
MSERLKSRTSALFLLYLLCWACTCSAGTLSTLTQSRWVEVAHVYDGDTFRTAKGEKVRLLGINTPEVAHNIEPGQPFGKRARTRLVQLLQGKLVRLRTDKNRHDNYGRLLAQVWLRDGTWINALLVREGLAHVYTFAPNFHWAGQLLQEERTARQAKTGIWSNRRFRVLNASQVSRRHIGQFRIVEGQAKGSKRAAFQLGELNVSIPRKYRTYFDPLPHLREGQPVRIRGTIRASSRGRLYLALHSPYDLEIIE